MHFLKKFAKKVFCDIIIGVPTKKYVGILEQTNIHEFLLPLTKKRTNNRIVKLIFKRKKDDFYCTTALIQTLKFKGAGRAGYVCYVIDYEDENNNLHTKELHTFCSIKSLKPGDKIKINVDRNNPDNIIVVDSDLLIAITICAAGIAFESFIIISYISVC